MIDLSGTAHAQAAGKAGNIFILYVYASVYFVYIRMFVHV